ncbi:MAG: PPOX class F420-dependent oxidoreductase [Actinobacteria bacterium]|nr:PPOX class F420-dependent oxidoreductase [Actinomycetota bacterium]
MRKLTDEQCLAFLAEGTRTGTLATVRPDGRPHAAPVWFVVDGRDVVFTTWHASVKARNLAADPRASLAVDIQEPPYGFVVAEGTVEVSSDPAEVRRIATAAGGRYMGADRAAEYGARNGVEGELVMRLRVERFIGRDDVSA